MNNDDGAQTAETLTADEAMSVTPVPAPTIVAGRYEIVGLLGTGGMGRVYRTVDRELGEVVALKMLHRELVASAEMVERFRQEVRLARRVTHRNVARTFDIGEHGGEKFLTMEFIAGESLASRLERGVPPVRETVAIAREILTGMSAAHAVGIVHRDLKPDNVMLEKGGRVVVTDFGIARAQRGSGPMNATGGRIVGTPAYMAPEQVGDRSDLDGRADLYAFGAILFEMLTGRAAWVGTSPLAVAAARLVDPPPDPRAHRAGLSASLAEVVLRCMAREREQRYATCADVDRALSVADAVEEAFAPAARHAPAADSRERSVAVMPFRNFGPPDDAHFVEGLTEDLVDVLATVRGLRVRGRAYAAETDRDVVDTGKRLGVDVVVDGSVRRAGQSLRVSARITGVVDGFQIWSSRFERPAGGAFALNDEVARAIATALSAEKVDNGPRSQPTDPVAIDLYFRARRAIARFWAGSDGLDPRQLLEEAVRRAPDDPTILAGFISVQIGRNFFAPLDKAEAVSLLRRALAAGGRLSEPWVALGGVRFNHNDDPSGAIRALKRAIDLAPSNSDAHDLAGRILLEANLVEDASAHLQRALWLDPLQRWARIDLMRGAALLGEWDRFREIFDGGEGADWTRDRVLQTPRLGSWHGAPDLPLPDLSTVTDARFHAVIEGYLRARASGRGGPDYSVEDVRRLIESVSARASLQRRARRVLWQMAAEISAVAGHPEGALEFVRSSVEEGLLDLMWLTRQRLLDPLRADPRFEALVARVTERADAVSNAWRGPSETLEAALASLG